MKVDGLLAWRNDVVVGIQWVGKVEWGTREFDEVNRFAGVEE